MNDAYRFFKKAMIAVATNFETPIPSVDDVERDFRQYRATNLRKTIQLLEKHPGILKSNILDELFVEKVKSTSKFRQEEELSLLELACKHHNYRIAKLAVKLDADVNESRTEFTPLGAACLYGDYEIVKLLALNGRVGVHQNCGDYSPISIAAWSKNPKSAFLLAALGADIDTVIEFSRLTLSIKHGIFRAHLDYNKMMRDHAEKTGSAYVKQRSLERYRDPANCFLLSSFTGLTRSLSMSSQ